MVVGVWVNEGVPLDLTNQLPPCPWSCCLEQLPAVNQLDWVVLVVKEVWLLEQGEELSVAEKGILEVTVVERAAVVLADQWTERALL